MAAKDIHETPAKGGRKKQFTERLQLPLAEGTTAKIDAVLEADEVRLDFIRGAIERELKRRAKSRPLAGDDS
ncbi:MAG: hypothetical protein KIT07_00525 [Anaerolineales bacterium]|nr:hypothetical protein [Nitrospira sp.]MCW5886589.1 hypothetical protein [Anaerolineales bacterium]